MFARIYRINLKAGQADAFNEAVQQQVIPLLRKHNGFRDEIAMVSVDGKEALGISMWERQEDAEAYERTGFAEVSRILAPLMTGSGELHKYNVGVSTAHGTMPGKAAAEQHAAGRRL